MFRLISTEKVCMLSISLSTRLRRFFTFSSSSVLNDWAGGTSKRSSIKLTNFSRFWILSPMSWQRAFDSPSLLSLLGLRGRLVVCGKSFRGATFGDEGFGGAGFLAGSTGRSFLGAVGLLGLVGFRAVVSTARYLFITLFSTPTISCLLLGCKSTGSQPLTYFFCRVSFLSFANFVYKCQLG